MGVGTPEDLVEAVARGVDIFDCVLPTRLARHGAALLRSSLGETGRGQLNLRNATHSDDPGPIERGCGCYACTHFSRAYLRHLVKAKEILAYQLISIHNLHVLIHLTHEMRAAIVAGEFDAFQRAFWASRGVEGDALE
jgi:queuine tRNA-ribosyltransferase